MNNAPFKIGQKVVCVDPMLWKDMKVGDEFTVLRSWVLRCGCSAIDIGLEGGYACSTHETPSLGGGRNAKCFAPIETNYSDATNEILEKFPLTEGGQVDKVITPEKIKI